MIGLMLHSGSVLSVSRSSHRWIYDIRIWFSTDAVVFSSYNGHLLWADAHPDAHRPFSAQGVTAVAACCTVDIYTQPVPDQEHYSGQPWALGPAQRGNVRTTSETGDGSRSITLERSPWIKWSYWKLGRDWRGVQTAGLATFEARISWR